MKIMSTLHFEFFMKRILGHFFNYLLFLLLYELDAVMESATTSKVCTLPLHALLSKLVGLIRRQTAWVYLCYGMSEGTA